MSLAEPMEAPPRESPGWEEAVRQTPGLKPFFDNLESFVELPEGVAKLRELFLDLAVRGKLVPQDFRDESAEVVIAKALRERKQLLKEKEISRRKVSEINNDEMPYQLPQGWAWARLGNITRDFGQEKPTANFTYIDVSTIDKERGIIHESPKILTAEEAPSRARKLVQNGTVIYSTVRPYLLNIAVVTRDFEPTPIVSTAFGILHPLADISNRYIYYYVRSRAFIAYVEAEQTGVAYPAINDGKLYNGPIPLPPLAAC